jgi:hypothetical protein
MSDSKQIEPTYPCQRCGKPRTKAQGGTTFTVCDECWDATSNTPKRVAKLRSERLHHHTGDCYGPSPNDESRVIQTCGKHEPNQGDFRDILPALFDVTEAAEKMVAFNHHAIGCGDTIEGDGVCSCGLKQMDDTLTMLLRLLR